SAGSTAHGPARPGACTAWTAVATPAGPARRAANRLRAGRRGHGRCRVVRLSRPRHARLWVVDGNGDPQVVELGVGVDVELVMAGGQLVARPFDEDVRTRDDGGFDLDDDVRWRNRAAVAAVARLPAGGGV